MSRILIVYGSSHGQTAKICRRIALMLSLEHHQVDLQKVDELPAETRFADFDGVLVAASVYYGKHLPLLTDLATRRAGELNHVPSAFLSVCGALAGSWPDGPAVAAKYVTEFIAKTGWHPNLTQSVAGAVAYTRYPFLTRMVMKLISARTGRPTDTSRDWEFTNWQEIDEFAAAIGKLIRPDTAVRPAVTEVS